MTVIVVSDEKRRELGNVCVKTSGTGLTRQEREPCACSCSPFDSTDNAAAPTRVDIIVDAIDVDAIDGDGDNAAAAVNPGRVSRGAEGI